MYRLSSSAQPIPVSLQPESIYWHLGALCSLLTREHKEGWAGAGGWVSGLPGNLRICIHRPPPSVRQSVRNFLCLTCDEEEFKLSICTALIWAV